MRSAFILLAAVSMFACAELTTEPHVSEGEFQVAMLNRITVNRITVNRITVNRIAVNRLALNRITVNKLALNTSTAGALLATEDGRQVLEYLVSCALPDELTVVGRVGDRTYEFPGHLALAPKWEDRALNKDEQRWVSACMIARVNVHEVSVQISLRGPHKALTVDPEESEGFTLQEGAFYGDIFEPADEPMEMVACRGRDQAAGEQAGLVARDCAEEDPERPGFTQCGFVYAGDCANFEPGPPNDHACKKAKKVKDEEGGDAGVAYDHCFDAPVLRDSEGGHGNAEKYSQVITIYVHP